jgi:hypothetical protein
MVNFIPHCGEKTGEQAARLFKKEKTTNGQEACSPVSPLPYSFLNKCHFFADFMVKSRIFEQHLSL